MTALHLRKSIGRSPLRRGCLFIPLAAVLGVFWPVACPAAAPNYTLTDLGILPGYIESNAVAVNNAGQIAGNLFDSNGVEHAFIYSNGTMTVLGVVSGYVSARAVSMNNAGQIVGTMSDGGGGFNAFSYFNGTMVALSHDGAPPGPEASFANDVNDSGLVVGGGPALYPNNTREDAWIFPSTDLGVVSGYTSSEAFAINNSGQIVLGETNGFAGQELFLYNGTFQDLGISVAGTGAGGTRPCTINNSGQIIGSFPYTGGDTGHPFFYANGSVTDLGPVVGNTATLYDINNSGQIVGTTLPSGSSAFVYYINGTNYLLRNLSISGGTGWVFYDARGINDSGQIVGRGYNNNSTDRRTRAFLLTPPVTTHGAGNISTRLAVGTNDNVLIGGIIIQGNAPKKVIIRAIGPSLQINGTPIPGRLEDPMLELHDGSGTLIGQNDDWRTTQIGGVITSDQVAAIQATNLAPSDDRESAIVATLQSANYTAIVRGKNNTTGIALVEAYDLDPENGARLAEISTRGFVQTGDNVMIGGFIFNQSGNATVLIRAIGPELTQRNVPNALQDPTLELHDGNGALIASNDNWKDTQQAQIQATGLAPSDDRESAILSSLAPGHYTAIVRGKNSSIGNALVEVYVLQ